MKTFETISRFVLFPLTVGIPQQIDAMAEFVYFLRYLKKLNKFKKCVMLLIFVSDC